LINLRFNSAKVILKGPNVPIESFSEKYLGMPLDIEWSLNEALKDLRDLVWKMV
jgi:hypothetical protein